MTKLDFGAFVFGGNVFGWTVHREEAFHLLDAFLDHGGRMIDTADALFQAGTVKLAPAEVAKLSAITS